MRLDNSLSRPGRESIFSIFWALQETSVHVATTLVIFVGQKAMFGRTESHFRHPTYFLDFNDSYETTV